jgi:hypothetical protein
MQSGFAGRGQNKPCFECGSTNHWKKGCPNLKNQQGHVQQKGQTGLPHGNGQTCRNGLQSKNWHFTAPGPCDSETKEVNGKNVYWCGTCKHWNKTHTMEVREARNPLKAHQLKPTWDLSMTHLLGSWTLAVPRISFITSVSKCH